MNIFELGENITLQPHPLGQSPFFSLLPLSQYPLPGIIQGHSLAEGRLAPPILKNGKGNSRKTIKNNDVSFIIGLILIELLAIKPGSFQK